MSSVCLLRQRGIPSGTPTRNNRWNFGVVPAAFVGGVVLNRGKWRQCRLWRLHVFTWVFRRHVVLCGCLWRLYWPVLCTTGADTHWTVQSGSGGLSEFCCSAYPEWSAESPSLFCTQVWFFFVQCPSVVFELCRIFKRSIIPPYRLDNFQTLNYSPVQTGHFSNAQWFPRTDWTIFKRSIIPPYRLDNFQTLNHSSVQTGYFTATLSCLNSANSCIPFLPILTSTKRLSLRGVLTAYQHGTERNGGAIEYYYFVIIITTTYCNWVTTITVQDTHQLKYSQYKHVPSV
jgi:hypothetical protein